ncbi:MAG TPA: hypothetical protein PKH33_14820 [bacterium]|nr:hypothetical protein [bacterium]
MTNASSNQPRRILCVIELVLALAVSIALLHFSVKGILSGLQSTGQTLEMAAKDKAQNDFHVVCYENWNTPFADFSYLEALNTFTDIVPLNGAGMDTMNFVQCWSERSSVTYTSEQINDSVIFLGGSVASGKGVPKSFQFQEVIKKIAVESNGEPVKTIDFTLETNTFSLIFEKYLELVRMNPRSIVYVWSPADTPFFSLEPPLAFENSVHWDQPNRFMIKNGYPEAQLLKGAWTLFQDRNDSKRWIKKINSKANKDGMEYLFSAIKTMRDEASVAGVDFSFVYIPLLEGQRDHYEYDDIHEKMSAFLAANGIPSLDIAPVLFNRNPREFRVNSINWRFNEEAHRRAAAAMVPFLGFHSKPSHWDSGLSDKRIRQSDISDDKYARTEEYPFCASIFFLLSFLLLSCVIAFILHLPLIMREISASGMKTFLLLLLIIIYASLLRIYVSPHAHLVLGDEYDRLRIIELWIAGIHGAHIYNIFPGAMMAYYPAYLLFGLHSQVGFYFSVFLSTVSCAIMFLVVKSFIKNNGAALVAAFLLANYPVCLRFSGSHAAENPNLIFMLVCVYALAQCRTNRSFISSFLFFISLSFFVFIRIHNIAFAIFILYCYMSYNSRHIVAEHDNSTHNIFSKIVASVVRTRSDIVPAFIFMFSFVSCLILIYISATIGDYNRNIETIAIGNHFVDNLRFFVSNKYLPIAFSVICSVSIILLLLKRHSVISRKTVVFFVLWIVIYFICHLQAGSGQYLRSSESVRHTMDFAAPLIVLTALGIYFIEKCFFGNIAKNTFRVSMFIFIALVPFSHMSEIRDKGYVDNLLRATVSVAGLYPKSALFITNTFLVFDAIDLDLRAPARLAHSPSDALRICSKGQECILVLYKNDQDADFEFIRNLCPESIHYINLKVAICPFDKLADIPASYFRRPSYEAGGGDYVSNLPYGMNIEMRDRNKTTQYQ